MSHAARIDELQERLQAINGQSNELLARCAAEQRDPTTEERTQLARAADDFETLEGEVEVLQRIDRQAEALSRPLGRRTAAEPPGRRQPEAEEYDGDGPQRAELHPGPAPGAKRRAELAYATPLGKRDGGFRSMGEYALSVAEACRRSGARIDPRLERLAVPSTVAGEGSGAEGGFAVPGDYRTSIMEKVMGEDSLLPRTDQITLTGNTLTVPRDNSTVWGTTGIRAYWGSEGGLKTQSRPVLDTMMLRLNKVYALIPVTDELLEDAAAMDAYIRRRGAEAIAFAVNLALIQGTGAGEPLGVLNSPALVSVAKETSQVADTLLARNITKMWSRMYAPSRRNAIWSCSQTVETQIAELHFPGRDATGADVTGWGSHVYIPPGGLSGSPYAQLYNRPVIPTQACNELGDKGDLILWDPTQYLTAIKGGVNPRTDVSMHLWFDYDITAFRMVLRITGQPWWDAPVTPRDGAQTLSPFVTLDERA